MEQDPLLLKDQADGMDVVVADKVEALKSIWLLVLHV
jgi:hypothetical protein